MGKVFCKFCKKYVTKVCYLIEPNEEALKRLKEKIRVHHQQTFDSSTLGCKVIIDEDKKDNISFQDEILEKKIAHYGLGDVHKKNNGARFAITAGDDDKMKSETGGFLTLTSEPRSIERSIEKKDFAWIDGQYLVYDSNNPATLLCCADCHMRLETHRVSKIKENGGHYYRSDESTDKNINIMFLGTRDSGKTVLLLAILNELVRRNFDYLSSFRKLNDQFVADYYDDLRIRLFSGIFDKATKKKIKEVPKATGTAQPPITLEVSKVSNKNEYKYKVTFIDTMGEMIKDGFDRVGVLNYTDAIVVIHPVDIKSDDFENETPIMSTCKCIGKLIGTTMTKSKKPTMLLFNKCDIFKDVAEEMMLAECTDLSDLSEM
ncbi:MAG: hypothetical protein V3G42_08785, partial [Oscillospiraceae bacterium]